MQKTITVYDPKDIIPQHGGHGMAGNIKQVGNQEKLKERMDKHFQKQTINCLQKCRLKFIEITQSLNKRYKYFWQCVS